MSSQTRHHGSPSSSAAVRSSIFEIQNVSKVFSRHRDGRVMETRALEDMNLEVASGEFVCVLGPSGCGKSTLLQLLAGLERPTSGDIVFQGEPVRRADTNRGFVFQRFNLFPWLTAEENIEFGLKLKGIPKDQRDTIAQEKLRLVRLSRFRHHYPRELSGGMQQRISLARTLALDPDVYLMDEPFGSLDAQTRLQMQDELISLWRGMEGRTVVFVTHDINEAILLGDRVVVMTARPGRIKGIVAIELPRPRDRFSPEFAAVAHQILDLLRDEIERSVAEELNEDETAEWAQQDEGRQGPRGVGTTGV